MWSPQLHCINKDKGSMENDAGTHLLTPRRAWQVEAPFLWAYPHLTALPRKVSGKDIYWRSQFVPQVPHRASMCSNSKWGGLRLWFNDLFSPVFILSTIAGAILLFFGAGSSVVRGIWALDFPHTCTATIWQALEKKVKPKASLPCRELPQQARDRGKKRGFFSFCPRVRDLTWSVLRKLRN